MFTKQIYTHPRKNMLWGEGVREGGDGKKGIQESKEQEKEKAKKWGLEVTSRIFLKGGNLSLSKTLLDQEINKAGVDKNKEPYKTVVEEIEIFMTKGIFEKDGKYKANSDQAIHQLRLALGDTKKNTYEEIVNKSELAKEFTKAKFNTYAERIIDFCIQHPQQIQDGIMGKVSRQLGGDKEHAIQLSLEKKKIDSLGGMIPEEYKVFIETVIHLTQTQEFADYTGLGDKLIRDKKDFSDYGRAFRFVINEAIRTGKVLKPKEILKGYQETIKLEEERMKKEAKEKEDYLRKKYTPEYYIQAFKNGKSPEEIKKSLEGAKSDIGNIWQKYGKYIGESGKDIWAIFNTVQNAAKNDILKDTIWNNLGNRTRDSYISTVANGLRKAGETKNTVQIEFSKEGGGYVAFGKSEIQDMLVNPEKINQNVWKGIMEQNYWESELRETGGQHLWAIGKYIENNPDTKLLKIIPEPRRSEVRSFLTGKLHEHSIDIKEMLGYNDYASRLYEKVKDLLPGISLDEFRTIAQDGKLEGKSLYAKINKGTPQAYLDFEGELRNRMSELGKELEKKIKSNKKDVKDIRGTLEEIPQNGVPSQLYQKKISELSASEAEIILTALNKRKNKDGTNTSEYEDILRAIVVGKTNDGNIGRSKSRSKAIEKNGVKAIEKIKKGEFAKIENASGEAYAAKQETNRQIESMSKNERLLHLLSRYGYTYEMLDNPGHVQNLYKLLQKLPDSPDKEFLLAYVTTLKGSQEEQIRSYAAIIHEVGKSEAIDYISTISGNRENERSIARYEFLNNHIIENPEKVNSDPIQSSISKIDIGASMPVSSINGFHDESMNGYSITHTSPDNYEVRGADNEILASGLTVEKSKEFLSTMHLFHDVGLNIFIPRIQLIREGLSKRKGLNVSLDGANNNTENILLLRELYKIIFSEDIVSTNIFEVIRAFTGHFLESNNPKAGMNKKLKEKGFLHPDNTNISTGEFERLFFA